MSKIPKISGTYQNFDYLQIISKGNLCYNFLENLKILNILCHFYNSESGLFREGKPFSFSNFTSIMQKLESLKPKNEWETDYQFSPYQQDVAFKALSLKPIF